MPELKKCPNNCETVLEKVSETEFYCSKCNLTYKLSEGKVKVSTDAQGRLTKIEVAIAELQKKQGDLINYLFTDDNESALPFF